MSVQTELRGAWPRRGEMPHLRCKHCRLPAMLSVHWVAPTPGSEGLCGGLALLAVGATVIAPAIDG